MSNNKMRMKKDWELKKLGDICHFIGGGTPSKNNLNYWNGNISWASIKDIKGQYLTETSDFITEDGLKNSATNLAFANEIILATRINPGRPIITKITTSINQDLKIVRPKIEVNNSFLYFMFLNIEKDVVKLSNGTTVLGITLNSLNDIDINLPPLKTQQLIVSKIDELFSELDKGVEELKTAQAQLKVYRQSVLKWAFEGRLTNENVEEGVLPKLWEVKKLGELFSFVGGGTPSKKDPSLWDGTIPWASIKDVKGNYLKQTSDYITEKGLKSSATNLAKTGELIIATRINPGRPIITKIDTTINQDLKIARIKGDLVLKFAYYYFLNIENEVLKKSSGTTVLGIRLEILNDINFNSPQLEEQNRIVQEIESRLSVADKLDETIKTNLEQAESLKQSILKKAFSGELV